MGVLREAAQRLTPVAETAIESVRGRASPSARSPPSSKPRCRRAGYERPAFDTIVASGPNSALPHYRAGDRVSHAGDLVVLDFGGVLDGYCSDLTRTVSVGTPSPEARQTPRTRFARRKRRRSTPSNPGSTTADVDGGRATVLVAAWAGRGVRARHRSRPRARRPRGASVSRSRAPMCRPSGSNRGWSSRSSPARIFPGLAASGSRTMCW